MGRSDSGRVADICIHTGLTTVFCYMQSRKKRRAVGERAQANPPFRLEEDKGGVFAIPQNYSLHVALLTFRYSSGGRVGAMDERRPLPSELSSEEQRMRAAQYRLLAATARTADTQDALLRLAREYEELAAGRA